MGAFDRNFPQNSQKLSRKIKAERAAIDSKDRSGDHIYQKIPKTFLIYFVGNNNKWTVPNTDCELDRKPSKPCHARFKRSRHGPIFPFEKYLRNIWEIPGNILKNDHGLIYS